jgi:hypothetical protein
LIWTQTFARTGNWGGVDKGVRHVHSYGTGWEDKRAELPVEQPTKVELVFKSRTAKALRLTIPHSLLVRAERVVE